MIAMDDEWWWAKLLWAVMNLSTLHTLGLPQPQQILVPQERGSNAHFSVTIVQLAATNVHACTGDCGASGASRELDIGCKLNRRWVKWNVLPITCPKIFKNSDFQLWPNHPWWFVALKDSDPPKQKLSWVPSGREKHWISATFPASILWLYRFNWSSKKNLWPIATHRSELQALAKTSKECCHGLGHCSFLKLLMGTNLSRVKKAQTASQCCLRFLHCVVGGWLETWEWKLDARWPIFMKPTCWMHQRQLLPISLKTNSCERGRGEVGSTPWQDWPFSNSDPQIHFEQHVSLQNEWKHGQRETPPIFWNAYVWYVADCSVDAIVLVCAMYNCLMYRQIDVYIYIYAYRFAECMCLSWIAKRFCFALRPHSSIFIFIIPVLQPLLGHTWAVTSSLSVNLLR